MVVRWYGIYLFLHLTQYRVKHLDKILHLCPPHVFFSTWLTPFIGNIVKKLLHYYFCKVCLISRCSNACTDNKKISFVSYCYCKQPPLHIDHKNYKVTGWEWCYTGDNSSSVYRDICVFEYVFFMWLNVILAKLNARQRWSAVSPRVLERGGQEFCAGVPHGLQLGLGWQVICVSLFLSDSLHCDFIPGPAHPSLLHW